ncbi:MAG: HEAT repeat domain-containing protein [Armatimonadota bacterium]
MRKARATFTCVVAFLWCRGAWGQDVDALVKTLRDGDEAGTIAAKRALADAGAEAVLPLLGLVAEDDPRLSQAARQTLRWLALRSANSEAARREVSERLLRAASSDADAVVRRLALDLLGIDADARFVPDIGALLRDAEVAEAACRALQHIPGAEATDALAAALPGAKPPLQVALLNALGTRGDARAVPDVLPLMTNDDSTVRAAAAEALGRVGDRESLEALLKAARDPDDAVRSAAVDACLRIASGFLRAGERESAKTAYESVLSVARTDAGIVGALAGLGEVAAPESLKAMKPFLSHRSSRVRVAATSAIGRLPGAPATKALAEVLAKAPPLEAMAALEALGKRGDSCALKAVQPLAAAGEADVRAQALWALGRLRSAEAISGIQAALEDEDATVRQAARDAYTHLAADLLAADDREHARSIYEDLARREPRDDEWVAALEGLAKVGSAESLPTLAAILDAAQGDEMEKAFAAYLGVCAAMLDRGEKPAAAKAYEEALKWVPELTDVEGAEFDAAYEKRVAIADGLADAGATEVAKRVYYAALEAVPADARLAEVASRLKAMGEPIDLAAVQGFVTQWWIIGPFPNVNGSAWDTKFFPEDEVDLGKEYEFEGKRMSWQRRTTDGLLNLAGQFGAGAAIENKACYAYAEVAVERAQPVTLRLGSDDAIICWVNGKRVHANLVDRGCAPDQDTATAEFRAGRNEILLKVLNNRGGWACVVRLCDSSGRPLKFTQPTPGAGRAKVRFEKVRIAGGESLVECCTVFDVDRDGRLDIVSGANWYQAPDWKPRPFRELTNDGNYANDWADLALDVNGDGWTDIISGGFHTEEVWWYDGKRGQSLFSPESAFADRGGLASAKKGSDPFFRPHLVFKRTAFFETMMLVDVDGDGQDDLLPNDGAPIRWYEVKRAEGGEPQWIEHVIGPKGAGHGIGSGDVDLDGDTDIITPSGWYEAPEDARAGIWTWHPEFSLGATSVPILATDVNADGLGDIIWGMGHDYGLFWLEQKRDGDERSWVKHTIDASLSQAHCPALADIDGDGDLDLVAGKRWKAHCGKDPGSDDPICVYWYEYDRGAGTWRRWVVSYKDGAGIGLQQSVVDIDGDGDLDIVSACKTGLHLFVNQGVK